MSQVRDPHIYYTETQRLDRRLAWVLSLAAALVVLFLTQVIGGRPVGDRPLSTGWFLALLVAGAIVLGLISQLTSLRTTVTGRHVTLTFGALHLLRVRYAVTAIRDVRRERVHPVQEYGGWGIRYAGRRGWGYLYDGVLGVRLTFADGRCVLVTSQRSQELEECVARLLPSFSPSPREP